MINLGTMGINCYMTFLLIPTATIKKQIRFIQDQRSKIKDEMYNILRKLVMLSRLNFQCELLLSKDINTVDLALLCKSKGKRRRGSDLSLIYNIAG